MFQESVVLAAIAVLQAQGIVAVPPVRAVHPREVAEVARVDDLRAFRLRADGRLDPVIYVVSTTGMFRSAERGSLPDTVLLASTIVHEMQHGTDNGEDERGALLAEVSFLKRYVRQNLVRLTTIDRRLLLRYADEIEYRARKIPVLQAAGPVIE